MDEKQVCKREIQKNEGAKGEEYFTTPPKSPPKKSSKITKAIKDQPERDNNGAIDQLSESSCSDTSDD